MASVLEEFDIDERASIELGVNSNSKAAIKAIFGAYFWNWYEENKSRKIKISLFRGLIRPTITISDLYPVFSLLFGPR